MFRGVPYEVLRRDFPEAVQQALESLRKGKSKARLDPPESFKWGFSWCVSVQGFTFGDLLSGKAQDDQARERAKTIDEKVQDYSRNCRVTVELKAGRGSWYSEALPETPQVILDQYRANLEEGAREQARIDALSPEERQRELDETLRQLRGPGFVEVHLPKREG